jgi:hypothetical protein
MAQLTVRFIPSWWIFETIVPEFQNAEFISALKIERRAIAFQKVSFD